ncbi:MAG: hypothetical protein IT370_24435 [Deltaproteobacteria bacterium]|nr:hypothetical protein [Deltaproteobacteria bacterium]
MISGRASRLGLAGLALGAGLVLRPPAARAVGDLPPPNSGSTPDVLILLDSTANQNSALLSLGPTVNYYLGSDGSIKQYHVWQRALTGSVVKPNNTINTPPPNAFDPDFDKGALDLYRDKIWFGMAGIDQATGTGTAANNGYSYGPSQVSRPSCSWNGSTIVCSGSSGAGNLGMRNDSAIGDIRELPFVRLHRSTQIADNALIQNILVQTTNPYQGNPDGLIDVFKDAIHYYETDYPSQANAGCGERFILYLGAGLPRPGMNDPIADIIYLRDTLKVTTYVVGLMDYTTPATNSYRKYMNALAVAGGGKCASEVLGGSDCAYLARYDNPGCTNSTWCDRLGANDLRTMLGTVLQNALGQVSSRTPAATASSPITSGSTASWRVGAAFQVAQGPGPWFGFLQGLQFDAAGNQIAKLDFHDLLDARAATSRVIYTRNSSGALTPLSSVLSSDFAATVADWRTQFIAANDSCLAYNFFDSTAELYRMVSGGVGDALGSLACLGASDESSIVTNYQAHKLGAIYHSAPFVVTPPELFLNDASYSAFRSAQQTRPLTVFVGANDGMLHAFALEDDTRSGGNDQGSERWAYMPRIVIPALATGIRANRELVDGSPVVRDVMEDRSSPTSAGWRTVLLGALGRGGPGFYALDVTDPAAPQPMWERSRADTGFGQLAMAYGPTAIGRLFVTDTEVPVAFLQGGWDPGEVDAGYPSGRGFTIVNLISGAIVWRFAQDCAGDTQCTDVPGLDAPVTGTPAPFDDMPTAMVTRTFVGDLKGRIWRIDTSRPDRAAWKMERFWPAVGSAYDNATYQLPIFLPPALAFDRSRNLVAIWSTGNIQDLDDPAQNQVWAVREELALPALVTDPPIVTPVQVWNAPKVLSASEKLVGDPVVFNGSVFFTTFRQTASACGFGEGRLYALDMLTGGPNFAPPPGSSGDCTTPGNSCIVTYGAAGTDDSVSLGSGVPSTALIRQRPATATVDPSTGRMSFAGGNYSAIVQMGASTKTDQFTDTAIVKDLGPLVRRADILSVAEYE